MANTKHFCVALSTVALCIGAEANNYVFFGQQPLTVVSAQGDFDSFELGRSPDDDGRLVVDERLAANFGTLWAYPMASEPQRTRAKVVLGYAGCDRALVVETEDKDYRGLLSSKRLSVSSVSPSKEPAGAWLREGRALLSAALKEHKLASHQIEGLLENMIVTPVAIFLGQPVSLVISAEDEINGQTATAFLVATPDARGRYAVSHEDVRTGTESDSDGYAGIIELAAHADVDGDGVEELLVRQSAYESFGVELLRWNGTDWGSVASNGGGC